MRQSVSELLSHVITSTCSVFYFEILLSPRLCVSAVELMSELYPLLLRPQFVERVWGARDLSPIYDKQLHARPIGEVWLTGDDCRIENGPLAGTSLVEACRRLGAELVGEAA